MGIIVGFLLGILFWLVFARTFERTQALKVENKSPVFHLWGDKTPYTPYIVIISLYEHYMLCLE